MGRSKIIIFPTSVGVKQAGQLKKLFSLWDNKKKRDHVTRELHPRSNVMKEGVPNFLSQSKGLRNTHVTRRQIVLNRHFTEIVSDVLALGFKKQLDELGVSLTSIETKAWNKGLCIFYTTNDKYDEQRHKELNKIVPELSAAITERRLIGRTPKISFVYDQTTLFDRQLSEALSHVHVDEKEETQLATTGRTELHISKDLGSYEQKLVSQRFMAPGDMDNNMFGLNYPMLYDEVASKLSRGRGEAVRIRPQVNSLADPKPLFIAPLEDLSTEDPMTRIRRMQKFIISQKKKSENLARTRRKAEIYARNSVKWQVIDDDGETLDKDEVTAQPSA